MTLTPAVVTAAEAIVEILDTLAEGHPDADVQWLAQALAAYTVSSDGGVSRSASGAQHVHMRRAIDEFLSKAGAHGIDEVLIEVLVGQGAALVPADLAKPTG